jgi:hypothetical protein
MALSVARPTTQLSRTGMGLRQLLNQERFHQKFHSFRCLGRTVQRQPFSWSNEFRSVEQWHGVGTSGLFTHSRIETFCHDVAGTALFTPQTTPADELN